MSKMSLTIGLKFLFLLLVFAGCESEKRQINAPVNPDFVPGDVNLNGVPYDFGDYILFQHYFVYGEGVFSIDLEKQIANTDLNLDGVTLRIEDLVLLKRRSNADEKGRLLPFDSTSSRTTKFVQEYDKVRVSTLDSLGAIYLIFAGYVEPVVLTDCPICWYPYVDYTYDQVENITKVIITNGTEESLNRQAIMARNLLENTRPGNLIEAHTATYRGKKVRTEILYGADPAISEFELYQNSPNPFDTITFIKFVVTRETYATFIITNDSGLIVFFGDIWYFQAGLNLIVWDGKDNSAQQLPNGTYFCSLIIEGQLQTIEMQLHR